jgi:hypothetical protein
MLQSLIILALFSLGLLGDLVVLARWRKPRVLGSLLARNMAIASLSLLVLAFAFALDIFTQVWVARPESISGPAFAACALLFLMLSIASITTLIVVQHRHSRAAA